METRPVMRWKPGPVARAQRSARVLLPFSRRRQTSDGQDLTPTDALRRLLAGNQRFGHGRPWSTHPEGAHRKHSAPSLAPFAAVIGCSDSPVQPEVLFDQDVGALFVLQLAGNVATTDEVASLEYAAGVSELRAILVLGHTRCGAVEAALARGPREGAIGALFQQIRSGLDPTCRDLLRAVEDNARAQRQRLLDGSAVLRDRIACGKLAIAAAVYDVATGTVRMIA